MSYLDPHRGHGSSSNVVHYCLEGHKGEERDRSLAVDYNLIPSERCNDTAWQYLDQIARLYGNDRDYHGKKAVTYYHFVLAPDPEDFKGKDPEAMLQKVRAMATAWVSRCAGEQPSMIAYHDDSSCGNIHAHVIVSTTNARTGKRWRVSNKDMRFQRQVLDEESHRQGLHALIDRLEQDEPSQKLDAINKARAGRGEREVHRTVSSPQTAQKVVLSKTERYMRGTASWKDRLRATIDQCAWEASTFSEFRRLLLAQGCDVKVTKSGQLTYQIDDRHCSAKKLGMMYQTDFLASQFMDLRYTRAAWASERHNWQQVSKAGIRVPKVTDEELESLFPRMEALGVYDLASCEAVIKAGRDNARIATSNAEILYRSRKQLEGDIADARYVESLRGEMERCRVRGRIADAPFPQEVVSKYEAARKRLGRRPYNTGLSALEARYADTVLEIADAEYDVGTATSRLREELEVRRILLGLLASLDSGMKLEQERYGSRIGQSVDALDSARHSAGSRRIPGIRRTADGGYAAVIYGHVPDEEELAASAAALAAKPEPVIIHLQPLLDSLSALESGDGEEPKDVSRVSEPEVQTPAKAQAEQIHVPEPAHEPAREAVPLPQQEKPIEPEEPTERYER